MDGALADWCENEFSSIDLGDERLNRRFIRFSQCLLSHPETSINAAHLGWTETKAAYRMLDNDKLKPELILEAHHDSLSQRVRNQVVLAIQDTTYFRFDALVDLRQENPRKRFRDMHGIVMHHCLAVSTSGLPFGQLYCKLYDRDIGSYYGGHYDHQKIPIEKKESFRWIEALRATSRFSQDHNVKFVTVADRECDIYEFLHEAEELREAYVIRAAKNRKTMDHSYVHSPDDKIWQNTENSPVLGSYQVELERGSGLATTELTVRVCKLILKPATRLREARSQKLSPVNVTCILVREKDPPKNTECIEWMLLTNTEVNTFEDACEKVSWYQKRWTIESFHKVLKSGFKAEKCQLRTPERLYRFIATISVLAVRLYELSQRARQEPLANCEVVLKEHEWKALEHKVKGKVSSAHNPPTLSDAMTWVAILGGYLNRNSDPPPGPIVMWRGWKRLQDIADSWLMFRETYG